MSARIVRSTMVQHLLQKPRSSSDADLTGAQRGLVPTSLRPRLPRHARVAPATPHPHQVLVRCGYVVSSESPPVQTFRDSPDPDSVQALMNPETPGRSVARDAHDEEPEAPLKAPGQNPTRPSRRRVRTRVATQGVVSAKAG